MARIALLFLVLGACTKDAEFSIDPPAAALSAETAVAVFGMYRDGRLDYDYWETLAPKISPAIGATSCAVAMEPSLAEREPAVYADIDKDTKENGVTAEVLAKYAARAPTPMIAVLQVTGHPPIPKATTKNAYDDTGTAAVAGGRGGAGGRRGHAAAAGNNDALTVDDQQRFELVFSLFDATKKTFVSRIALHYAGYSADDALTQFTNKVKEVLPGMKCVSWATQSK